MPEERREARLSFPRAPGELSGARPRKRVLPPGARDGRACPAGRDDRRAGRGDRRGDAPGRPDPLLRRWRGRGDPRGRAEPGSVRRLRVRPGRNAPQLREHRWRAATPTDDVRAARASARHRPPNEGRGGRRRRGLDAPGDAVDVRRRGDREERRGVKAALEALEAEPGSLNRRVGVPGRLAAPEGLRPEEPVEDALERPEQHVPRADVLPEAELSAFPQHPPELLEDDARVGDAAEDAHDDDGVEGSVVGGSRSAMPSAIWIGTIAVLARSAADSLAVASGSTASSAVTPGG